MLYLSLDPTNRIWMTRPGAVYAAGADRRGDARRRPGQVVESQRPAYQVGDLVTGLTGWQDYAVRRAGARC